MVISEVLKSLEQSGVKLSALASKANISRQAVIMVKNQHNIDFSPDNKKAIVKAINELREELNKVGVLLNEG